MKALIDHHEKKFRQVTKAAQKSNSAGLLIMASAINKYHQIKGQYPKDLSMLYPEFIPDQSFVSSLNWRYTKGRGTYLIKRNIKGSQTFSSMGPDLRLKTGRPETASPAEKIVSAKKSKPEAKQPTLKRPTSKPYKKNMAIAPPVANAFIPDAIKKTGKLKSNDRTKRSEDKPEFAIVKKELNSDEKFLLSLKGNNLYIWKGSDGIIGFSNNQYPIEKNLAIYENKSWIEYQYSQNIGDQK
ncbi:hypothetical protein [Desulfobacula sp.]|uniref:hypothetical protein n=1 Tax=Desulfobacula sp. TaxID=2593537 RepID=UPI002639A5A2|nr:hypothetical protein [Desulfobacula sp.]